jgi:hypothetical protein
MIDDIDFVHPEHATLLTFSLDYLFCAGVMPVGQKSPVDTDVLHSSPTGTYTTSVHVPFLHCFHTKECEKHPPIFLLALHTVALATRCTVHLRRLAHFIFLHGHTRDALPVRIPGTTAGCRADENLRDPSIRSGFYGAFRTDLRAGKERRRQENESCCRPAGVIYLNFNSSTTL